MTQPIAIPDADIDDLRPDARAAIRNARLAELFAEIDPGLYGPGTSGATVQSLDLLGAIDTGVACTVAAHRAVVGRIRADRRAGFAGGALTVHEARFCCLMATYVGASEALARCAVDPRALPPPDKHLPLAEYRPLLMPEGHDVDSVADKALAPGLLGDLAGYVRFYRDHRDERVRVRGDKLRACVASYFALLGATCARLGDDGEHRATREALRDAGLHILGAEYHGFERDTAMPVVEEAGLMPVGPDDIVGNQEVLRAGMSLARAVAGFDLALGKNPRPIRNPVLFVLGSPGCGKTVTAHAVGNYFLDLCQQHGIPARFRIIRRTDWASHYQNKSANELLRIFRQEIFEFPGVAGVYWPDIDTAFAAREDAGIRAEEKAVLGTLFGLLDGTIGPKNGKWFLLADANFLTMDQAALSRLTQDPHHARGPQTADDFVVLLRDKKLGKLSGHFALGDDDWQRFGQRCVDAGLSGRAVDNMAGKLLAQVDDVDVPDEYFGLGYDDKVALLESRRKSFDAGHLSQVLDRYIEFEKQAEERAQKERFERRVREIRENLAARFAAVGGPLADGDGDGDGGEQ